MSLHHAVAITHSKGGIGKTSIAANVAALAAQSGWKVLVVDLDKQGHQAVAFGVVDQSDNGLALFDAVYRQEPLRPLRDVRDRLDLLCGGMELVDLEILLSTKLGTKPELLLTLRQALSTVADEYDLIVIDCPPAGTTTTNLAMAAAHGLVMPMKLDGFSLKSLEDIDEQFKAIRSNYNHDLKLLGIVLFDVKQNATRMQATMQDLLDEVFEGDAPTFTATVRHAGAAALQMTLQGRLAHEYETDAETYWAATTVGERIASGSDYSPTARGLAEDYTALAKEIFERLLGGTEPAKSDVVVDLTQALATGSEA